MAARQTRLVAAAVLGALAVLWAPRHLPVLAQTRANARPASIISLVPAVTEMLFEIGAGEAVTAVSRYDTFPRSVRTLPKVGGLLDPDYEAIVRLGPDLVVTYGSQTELERRLAAGGVSVYSYRHAGIAGAIRTMRELGEATGRTAAAEAAIDRLESRLAGIRARVMGRRAVRTLLVFGREPGTLRQVYASGGIGFEHELLEVAGGVNVFAEVMRESVQPSIEVLLARAPDAIVELHGTSPPEARVIASDHEVWGRLSSVPAVRTGRVHVLYGEGLSIPGPRMGDTAEAIAKVLHPDAFQ